MTPGTTAAVDQVAARTAETLDHLVEVAREMSDDGVDPAQQVTLIGLTLWETLGDGQSAELAGLAAVAILRLAQTSDGAT